MRQTLILGMVMILTPITLGQMVITEWMYSGTDGEFIEFTNVGTDPVNMSGWSFDDSGQVPGTVDLSAFGLVAPGESVILTQAAAADFAVAWGLTDVAIIGGLTANLDRNDQINLYDSNEVLVDQLIYGDENYPGTPRTQRAGCSIPESDYDQTVAQKNWSLAAVGDAFGSWMSAGGDIASPGRIVGYALSDYDRDDDVDLADFADFISCYLSEGYPASCVLTPDENGIIPADADEDFDVDLLDFSTFSICYSGEGNPADPACGRNFQTLDVTHITLNGDSIAVNGTGVTVDGTTAAITAPGTYRIRGTLNDGQIAINSPAAGVVEIILDGVMISSSTSAAINVIDAAFVSLVLADQTQNCLFDADEYIYTDPNQEPSGCVFSNDSMLISGTGEMTVYGNCNDGIVSKDELIIQGGTIKVFSIDDGIRGKDYLLLQNGSITLTTGGDALKSDNTDDPNLGYITIENGTLDIISNGDAIAAETNVTVRAGNITIVSGGGRTESVSSSAKGIKGLGSVLIEGGTLNLDCADDGLHSNNTVIISGGTAAIASGQDGIHADNAVRIDGGTLTITNSYEGIESTNITISSGSVNIASEEDAITAENTVSITGGQFSIFSGGGHTKTTADSAKGIKGLASVVISGGTFVMDCADDAIHSNDAVIIRSGTFEVATGDDAVHAENTIEISGGTLSITNSYEGLESSNITINDGDIRITSSDDGINVAGGDSSGGWGPSQPGNYYLYINGGRIVVDAGGDGIDANGSIEMTGGTVIVHGPTVDYDNAVDFDRTCNIKGGFLVAVGSSQMAQAPSTSSTQRSVKITYSQWKSPGTLIRIANTAGQDILTFAPAKSYKSCVFSSPNLQSGTSYNLYNGGNSTGTVTDGLYQNGTYTPGTLTKTFTANSIVTSINAP